MCHTEMIRCYLLTIVTMISPVDFTAILIFLTMLIFTRVIMVAHYLVKIKIVIVLIVVLMMTGMMKAHLVKVTVNMDVNMQ